PAALEPRQPTVSFRPTVGTEEDETGHGASDLLRLAFGADPVDRPQLDGALARADGPFATVVLAQERLHVARQLAIHLLFDLLDPLVGHALRRKPDLSQHRCHRVGHHSFLRNSSPSSRERRVAASTAFISTLRSPPASRVCRPASAACSPSAIAVAAAATVAGVLGMARTMRMGGCSRRSMAAIGTPAATLTISFSRETSPPMSRRTWSRICGLTASTITSAWRATSEFVPPRTP